MSSAFVMVRYPDGAWDVAESKNVPKAGDTLTRGNGKWVVATAVTDASGHVIVTWRPAPRPAE